MRIFGDLFLLLLTGIHCSLSGSEISRDWGGLDNEFVQASALIDAAGLVDRTGFSLTFLGLVLSKALGSGTFRARMHRG